MVAARSILGILILNLRITSMDKMLRPYIRPKAKLVDSRALRFSCVAVLSCLSQEYGAFFITVKLWILIINYIYIYVIE